MMVPMIRKLCNICGVRCWHTPRKPPAKGNEQGYRCTFCGAPVTNQKDSTKKIYGDILQAKQVSRARTMGITEV